MVQQQAKLTIKDSQVTGTLDLHATGRPSAGKKWIVGYVSDKVNVGGTNYVIALSCYRDPESKEERQAIEERRIEKMRNS